MSNRAHAPEDRLGTLLTRLHQSTTLPTKSELEDVDDPVQIYAERLEKACDIVREAVTLNHDDWNALLKVADDRISALCHGAYEADDDMDCLDVYGAPPEAEDRIRSGCISLSKRVGSMPVRWVSSSFIL